jgi:hypothetical protein
MLRLGDAASEEEAKAKAHALIDRAIALEQSLQKRGIANFQNPSLGVMD